MKLLEENIEKTLHDLGVGKYFLDESQKNMLYKKILINSVQWSL